MEKQLNFFCQESDEQSVKKLTSQKPNLLASPEKISVLHVFIDGAARGNPGPAGAGVFITDTKEPLVQQGIFLGTRTNNQAEYLALLLALYFVATYCSSQKIPLPELRIFSDSELLVKQLQRKYAVKNDILYILFQTAESFLKNTPHSFTHILREKNKNADKLANQGVDKKTKIPTDFSKFMSDYNPLICTLL